MKTVIDNAKEAICNAMAVHYPRYTVRFESAGDEPCTLGVGVFCVLPEDFSRVQDFVFDLEDAITLPEGWDLLPLVRDQEVTRKCYPNMMPSWSGHVCSELDSFTVLPVGHVGHAETHTPSNNDYSAFLENIDLSAISNKWSDCVLLRKPQSHTQSLSSLSELAKAA